MLMIGDILRLRIPSPVGRLLRQARWRARRISASLCYGRSALQQTPILFGNSFPKSGTHLLAQILHAFPQVGPAIDRGMGPILTFVPETGRKRAAQEILADLRTLHAGDLCFGHVIADPEVVAYLSQQRVAHYFILRDPRDVIISHAFFLADKAIDHVHHAYYKELTTLDERIRVSILGRPGWNGQAIPGQDAQDGGFPDIAARFQPYLAWLSQPGVLVLRFEDFILSRADALNRMLDYTEQQGFKPRLGRDQVLEILNYAIDPKSSFTFRGGRVGDWQKHFTSEHKQLFKECARDLLIQLGYEQDNNW